MIAYVFDPPEAVDQIAGILVTIDAENPDPDARIEVAVRFAPGAVWSPPLDLAERVNGDAGEGRR